MLCDMLSDVLDVACFNRQVLHKGPGLRGGKLPNQDLIKKKSGSIDAHEPTRVSATHAFWGLASIFFGCPIVARRVCFSRSCEHLCRRVSKCTYCAVNI